MTNSYLVHITRQWDLVLTKILVLEYYGSKRIHILRVVRILLADLSVRILLLAGFQHPTYMASRQLLMTRIAASGTSFSPLPYHAWHSDMVISAHHVEVVVGACERTPFWGRRCAAGGRFMR
jgi:hypothetical protein